MNCHFRPVLVHVLVNSKTSKSGTSIRKVIIDLEKPLRQSPRMVNFQLILWSHVTTLRRNTLSSANRRLVTVACLFSD